MAFDTEILIVDDERENVRYLTIILEENGFTNIRSAANGEEGLRRLEESLPGLIVLDIRMPKKSGIQMFNDLKKVERFKDIPIIILTGEAEFLQQVAALRSFHEDREPLPQRPVEEILPLIIDARPEAFLDKPIDPDAFLEAVQRVLAG
jgi:CheY-like chemotaxis protein